MLPNQHIALMGMRPNMPQEQANMMMMAQQQQQMLGMTGFPMGYIRPQGMFHGWSVGSEMNMAQQMIIAQQQQMMQQKQQGKSGGSGSTGPLPRQGHRGS